MFRTVDPAMRVLRPLAKLEIVGMGFLGGASRVLARAVELSRVLI
jgi:hypothetical protein